jgi:hypothetical protein
MTAKVSGALVHARTANPALPRHVADALMLGLEADPTKRPVSAGTLCQMLNGELPLPSPDSAGASGARRGRRRYSRAEKAAIITATIAALGGVVAAGISALSGKK